MPVHEPVLVEEVLTYLAVKKGGVYIDATVGEGGHAEKIAQKIGNEGVLVGIDANRAILTYAEGLLSQYGAEIHLKHGSYKDIRHIVSELGIEQADGVLLDIGLSSWLLEESGRGFSFKKREPLDMRFNVADGGKTAQEIIRTSTPDKLEHIFEQGGMTSFSSRRKLAEIMYKNRTQLHTTTDLVDLLASEWKSAPTALIFQSLRIAVNNEFEALKQAIWGALELLVPHGRLVILSFHSGEDRIVKHQFKSLRREGKVTLLTPKPIKAQREEYNKNPRCRSALLRACEKI